MKTIYLVYEIEKRYPQLIKHNIRAFSERDLAEKFKQNLENKIRLIYSEYQENMIYYADKFLKSGNYIRPVYDMLTEIITKLNIPDDLLLFFHFNELIPPNFQIEEIEYEEKT
jgi:hypothetical protein